MGLFIAKFKIWGHRRSGNNFLKHSLKLNFNLDKIHVAHWPMDEVIESIALNEPGIHIIRDGRDVMVSSFHWWKLQKGSKDRFRNATFQDYIYGRTSLPKRIYKKSYKRHIPEDEMFTDPIGYWAAHVDGWHNKIYTIKFEDLKSSAIETLNIISKELKLERKLNKIKAVKNLVGHAPRKGVVGDYKNYFKKKDEEYFWQKAGEVMEKYGYKR